MHKPLVSVIIPTYNRVCIIGETIENILQQTYRHIEIIVVDDGSTDNTPAVLSSYGNKIRWITQKNAGPSAARNAGIAIANGEIIAFQDSDDLWEKTKIERQVNLMERAGDTVVCCLCNCVVEQSGEEVTLSFDRAPLHPVTAEGVWLNVTEILSTRCVLFNQGAAVRRDVLERIGGFDESFRILEDAELALRLSLEGPWAFIREPLAIRQTKVENSLSQETTPLVVAQNMSRLLEGVLHIVESRRQYISLRPRIVRELARSRRYLRAAQFQSSGRFGAWPLGWMLERIEDYRQAAYRRTPWFPRMKVCPVDPKIHQALIDPDTTRRSLQPEPPDSAFRNTNGESNHSPM